MTGYEPRVLLVYVSKNFFLQQASEMGDIISNEETDT